MLKVYNVDHYVSVDGVDWREVGCQGYKVTDEEPKDALILDNMSFDEVHEYISEHALSGVHNDSTFSLFGEGKPIILVDYYDAWDYVAYRSFDKMSYKIEFTEWTDVSFEWLAKHLPADQFIQYLKERGMSVCPMNF